MNWACGAYNRTATVANSGNRSPQEIFYGETPQSSPISFLKPGFCKFKRTNKIDPKAREYLYLGPARNRLSESKHVLVRKEKVNITRNVTWAHVPFPRPPTVRSTLSVEREGCDHGMNQEASSFGGDTESGDDESESSGEGVEMGTPLISGRAASTTSHAGSSVHSGVSALRTGGAKRLAEHIPGPLRATISKGRTRAEERR